MALKPRMPLPSEQVIDQQTGLMNQTWYDFLQSATQPEILGNFADDTAAKAGGIPLFGLYRTGATVKVRVS